jgi:hypothetical protein
MRLRLTLFWNCLPQNGPVSLLEWRTLWWKRRSCFGQIRSDPENQMIVWQVDDGRRRLCVTYFWLTEFLPFLHLVFASTDRSQEPDRYLYFWKPPVTGTCSSHHSRYLPSLNPLTFDSEYFWDQKSPRRPFSAVWNREPWELQRPRASQDPWQYQFHIQS